MLRSCTLRSANSSNEKLEVTFILGFLLAIKDVCSQPKVVGPCRAAFRRFWYNRRTNQCERFIYGGCRGNENNFETIQECQRRCQRNTCKACLILHFVMIPIFACLINLWESWLE